MEPHKLAQLKDELEMTKESTEDPEVLIKHWRKKMKNLKGNFSPRSYLIYYLKCINLHKVAERYLPQKKSLPKGSSQPYFYF